MNARALEDVSENLDQVSTRRGVARLLGGIAALGGLAAIEREEVAAKTKKKKSKNTKQAKTGQPGPAGPSGPTGPTGPAGEPGAFPTSVTVTGERSAILGANVGSQVEAIANCGPNSIPLNCGWTIVGNTSDFDRTVTEVTPGFLRGEGLCRANLRRTATVGNAGGQIIVTAMCTRPGGLESERRTN